MPLKTAITGGIWANPSMGSIWTNYGAPFDPVGYRKDSLGVVYLRGWIVWVTGANISMFTLPVGFRPTGLKRFLVGGATQQNAIATSMVEVRANGEVWWQGYGTYFYIGLDEISFATF